MKVGYFTQAHFRWECGTNENANGLNREYIPKGIEIPEGHKISAGHSDELNDRPVL
jgi:IS30 family transposase